jgi:hypothetical protein
MNCTVKYMRPYLEESKKLCYLIPNFRNKINWFFLTQQDQLMKNTKPPYILTTSIWYETPKKSIL